MEIVTSHIKLQIQYLVVDENNAKLKDANESFWAMISQKRSEAMFLRLR